MSIKAAEMAYVVNGPSFIELVYSIGGWALTQTCLFMIHSGFYSHVLTSLPWLAPAGLAAWRSLQYKSYNERVLIAKQHRGFTIGDVGWALALLAVGGLIGALTVTGSAFLLFIVAGGFSYAPWHRVPLCRQHLAWACLIMLSGSVVVLGGSHKAISVMSLAVSAWALLGCCACALLWKTRKVKGVQLDVNMEPEPAERQVS